MIDSTIDFLISELESIGFKSIGQGWYQHKNGREVMISMKDGDLYGLTTPYNGKFVEKFIYIDDLFLVPKLMLWIKEILKLDK